MITSSFTEDYRIQYYAWCSPLSYSSDLSVIRNINKKQLSTIFKLQIGFLSYEEYCRLGSDIVWYHRCGEACCFHLY
jgi:hypothetical protein